MGRYVYTGNPNTKPRKVAGKVTRTRKPAEKTYRLTGGPYDGHKIALSTPSTAVLKVNGWHGFYMGRDNAATEAAPLDWRDVK